MSLLIEEPEKKAAREAEGHPAKNSAPKMRVQEEEEQALGFLRQNRTPLAIATVFLAGMAFVGFKIFTGDSKPTVRKAPEMTMVRLQLPPPPLPPPPPPPPQQAPPPEEKMIEQAPVDNEPKPEEKPEPPAPAMGTGIKGNGPPDGFGLSGSRGNGALGGRGNGSGGGGKWDGYARQLQSKIAEALRSNRKTRMAEFSLQVRVWPDATGRIIRAQLVGTSGDPAVDAAIKNDALTGLQLPEPPPAGMPASTLIRLSAKKPR